MVYNGSGDRMKIKDLKGLYIAHRGLHNDVIVENTIPAFSLALDKKIPIELDIRILEDGSLIVFHDENLKRLMNVDRKVSSCTYEELKKMFFCNNNGHIPMLQDVLKLVDGKVLLVIEIKKSDSCSYKEYCKKVVSVLDNYSGDFVIKSFDVRIVNWFLKNTNYITGLLIANRKKSFYDWLMNKKVTVSILKPDFLSVDYSIIHSKMVQDFRKKNPVLVWTIKNSEILKNVEKNADSYLIERCYF